MRKVVASPLSSNKTVSDLPQKKTESQHQTRLDMCTFCIHDQVVLKNRFRFVISMPPCSRKDNMMRENKTLTLSKENISCESAEVVSCKETHSPKNIDERLAA